MIVEHDAAFREHCKAPLSIPAGKAKWSTKHRYSQVARLQSQSKLETCEKLRQCTRSFARRIGLRRSSRWVGVVAVVVLALCFFTYFMCSAMWPGLACTSSKCYLLPNPGLGRAWRLELGQLLRAVDVQEASSALPEAKSRQCRVRKRDDICQGSIAPAE